MGRPLFAQGSHPMGHTPWVSHGLPVLAEWVAYCSPMGLPIVYTSDACAFPINISAKPSTELQSVARTLHVGVTVALLTPPFVV